MKGDDKNMGKKIAENAEITNLKKILDLQSDKKYTSTKDLRYGSVMLMTDQDEDGSHIKGLLFNLFQSLWPGLFKMDGFNKSMLTPLSKPLRENKLNPSIIIVIMNNGKLIRRAGQSNTIRDLARAHPRKPKSISAI